MDMGIAGALAASLATSALLSMLLNALPAAVLSRGRDDPRVVWFRARALAGFTLAVVVLAWLWLAFAFSAAELAALSAPRMPTGARWEGGGWTERFALAANLMRLWPQWDVRGAACGLGVVAVLFLGPLVDGVWEGVELYRARSASAAGAGLRFHGPPDGRAEGADVNAAPDSSKPREAATDWRLLGRCVLASLSDMDDAVQCPPPHDRARQLIIVRDLVAAPLLEEALFRCAVGAVLLAAGASPTAAFWLDPIAFAGAHMHHGWRQFRDGAPLASVAASVLFRSAYTFVFGLLAMHLWLGGPTPAGAVVAHMACNWLGPPDIARVIRSVNASRLPGSAAAVCAARARAAVVVCAYLAGVVGFFLAAPRLTAWASAA
ncbi:hypothetical protein FNF31_00848 [Cafeteria roenbergensis]|uniref:intramembrane prenyl-peptidase Rce1 n=1 Tax=Cafeteria roenbergensis TaxID=33653 RepID=A0A5A8DRZ0_CAFRO|nr:hypothetical protein FNF31_00848 [Cafeteria roenbergensis]